jgi:hypothetical protein
MKAYSIQFSGSFESDVAGSHGFKWPSETPVDIRPWTPDNPDGAFVPQYFHAAGLGSHGLNLYAVRDGNGDIVELQIMHWTLKRAGDPRIPLHYAQAYPSSDVHTEDMAWAAKFKEGEPIAVVLAFPGNKFTGQLTLTAVEN